MRRSPGTLRKRQGRKRLDQENMVRKVAISTSEGSDWGILGYEFEDPETGETVCEGEGDDPIPVFQGIGICARPVGANGEAMMLHVGGEADHPIAASVRDEDGRRAYVDNFEDLAPGELAIYNGQGNARVVIKADGSIEINSESQVRVKTKSGTADKLITRTEFLNHGHPTAATGPVSAPAEIVPSGGSPFPGTQILEAE